MNDPKTWVRDQVIIEARTLQGDVYACGVVVGWTDEPTFGVRRADGTIFQWAERLCSPAGEKAAAEFLSSGKAASPTGGQERSPAVEYLESEVAYWRERAETLAEKIRNLGEYDTTMPPEPPVGTTFHLEDDCEKVWERREDGWHCSREGCLNCPCEWVEAWDTALKYSGTTRRLP